MNIMSFNDTPNSATLPSGATEYVSRLQATHKEQGEILKEVLQKNLELEARVKALEYDNWRLRTDRDRYRAESREAMEKRRVQKSEFQMMKSEYEAFKTENPLIVCLLDGDGCIFSQEYLVEGYAGGLKAAAALSSEVKKYLHMIPEAVPAGARMITMIFLSKAGLESVLHRSGICKPEEFTAFLNGFGGAHQLFSIVDVGTGKEAADHKIREHLEVFIRMPQTFKVFFGGGHDNGYHGPLAALHTLGYKEKLVLLQSYAQTAREIGSLGLPSLEIPGLFMADKLDKRPILKKPRPQSEPLLSEKPPLHGVTPPPPTTAAATTAASAQKKKTKVGKKKGAAVPVVPASRERIVLPGVLVEEDDDDDEKEERLLCMRQHMDDRGCQSKDCPFDHDSDPTPEQQVMLKDMAMSTPCRFINDNLPCILRECNFGHECPRGPRCDLYGQGLCKFKGETMHD